MPLPTNDLHVVHEEFTLAGIRGILPEVKPYQWDVCDDFPEEVSLPDSLDGLVYLPGSIRLKPFPGLKDEHYIEDFEVNVLGAVRAIRACIKPLKAGKGSVVLFGSVAAGTGFPFHASIGTAKAALEGLVRSLAAEYAASDVRFNMLALSLTETPLAAGLLKTEKQKEAAVNRHPLKSIGHPGEAAEWAVRLLSESSRLMTGQVIRLDGGISSVRTG